MENLEALNLQIVIIMTVGFAFASLLGYLSQLAKLSPILGYLVAGYIIGPYSPGLVVNLHISEQLAEIGVILMMFGVGLHLQWKHLVGVSKVAIPGALCQTAFSSAAGAALAYYIGWNLEAGLILGIALGVASTVVLVRVLTDFNILNSEEGHIAVGWLIVEDLLTVFILLLLPILALISQGTPQPLAEIAKSVGLIFFKFALLIGVLVLFGRKIASYILRNVARTNSHELFTLTVLALTFLIATGAAILFGTSIALGAFLAGMMIGQTEARHQAFASLMPLKDTFLVIFFLSIGMLFNPVAIVENFYFFLAVFGIIIIVKPISAFILMRFMRYPIKPSVTVALTLAQIGEFSFVLAEQGSALQILPEVGYDIIIAAALISIALNPMLFRCVNFITTILGGNKTPFLEKNPIKSSSYRTAIVVGLGSIGQEVFNNLKNAGFIPIVIDKDVDLVNKLTLHGIEAIYGDATSPQILDAANISSARMLVITISDVLAARLITKNARHMNSKVRIWAYAIGLQGSKLLKGTRITVICSQEEAIRSFRKSLSRQSVLEIQSNWYSKDDYL